MLFRRSELRNGYIRVATAAVPKTDAPKGIRNLGLHPDRDALVYVPKSYDAQKPAPFVLLLHGAGGSAEHGLFLLKHLAEETNIILLAPSSRSNSWDIIDQGCFDTDVLFINQAMELVFQTYAIDPDRLAIGGFSDGASYALSLGLTNGCLFSHIIAFSPGFVPTAERHGKPAIFISHGTKDTVLPVIPCSRRIVPKLEHMGYEVTYHEFDGGHTIPDAISAAAVTWFQQTNKQDQ